MKMVVEMEVTEAQGLTLQAMFEYWNTLSSAGASRYVSFMCDGDGNFHPNCKISFNSPVSNLTDDLRNASIRDGFSTKNFPYPERKYDFDGLAWKLSEQVKLLDDR